MHEPPALPALDDAALLAYALAAAGLAGIPVDPAWRDEVVANLRAVGNAARLVLEFPLAEDAEPAPVFRA